jgi:hypothetical protein
LPFEVVTLIAAICLWEAQAVAADGLTTLRSNYAPQENDEQARSEVKAKGLSHFLASIIRWGRKG